MSDVAEEAMDSSAVSEEDVEDQQETSQDDQSSPNKSCSSVPGKEILFISVVKSTTE